MLHLEFLKPHLNHTRGLVEGNSLMVLLQGDDQPNVKMTFHSSAKKEGSFTKLNSNIDFPL